MIEGLAEITSLTQSVAAGVVLVFVRVSALVALLPGFGEQSIPMRVRLGIAVAFTILVWPLSGANSLPPMTVMEMMPVLLREAVIGVFVGLSIRILVMALQFAGSIAAQSTSLSQMMGAGATPDPMPAVGNILLISGMALALATGLHVKAVIAMAQVYQVLPIGSVPAGSDIAAWGVSRSAAAFGLAFTLAAPFVIASFAYNLTLGFINRAMPQLMVAFIGAPAITAGGMLILLLSAPVILAVWTGNLDRALEQPFEDLR